LSQVDVQDFFDLLVRQLLGCAEQSVARIADDHVDPPAPRKRAVDDLTNGRRVAHLERFGVEPLGIPRGEIGDGAPVASDANGTGHAIAAREKLFGHAASETAADACDEPRAWYHGEFPGRIVDFRASPVPG